MSKNKLQKFSELATFPNTYQNFDLNSGVLTDSQGEEKRLKGKWNEIHFKNTNPITIELACGRGEYTLALARIFPERNFIGIDIKGARIWKGAKAALEEQLSNAAFLRTRIEQITRFFEAGEVDEIWITFPDPFLKKGKSNRRLTASPFLKRYFQFLKPDGLIHLKTDSPELFDFSLESIRETNCRLLIKDEDIYGKPLIMEELGFKTYYENMHLSAGKKIRYLRFKLPDNGF